MTRKFCTRWEFLPPPIALGQGFARARGRVKYPTKVLFHSRVPTIPGNTINRLALGGQTPSRFGARDVSFHVLGLHCRPGTPKCQSRFGSTSNPSNSSELPNPVLGLLLLALEHMSMHVARVGVDKSRYVFVCMLKVYGSRDWTMYELCFQDSFGFA